MRVLVMGDWPADEGGAETQITAIVAGLRAAGDDVMLVTSDRGRGVEVADVAIRAFDSAPARAVFQLANPFAARAVRRAVSSFRPDAALVSMFEMYLSPSAVTALGDVPYVLNVVWYKPVCPTGLKLLPSGQLCRVRAGAVCRSTGCVGTLEAVRTRLRYARIDAAVKAASGVVTCSGWMVDELAQAEISAAYLPLPVDPPSAGYVRRAADHPVLAVVGRLAPEKGIDTLFDALHVLDGRGVRPVLRIVGDGPLRPDLERRSAASPLGSRIDWVGHVPHDDVERHLADAWALVAPSRWAEPFGLVAVEAIVRGVPVVAGATGGFAESVAEGETGLLFPNGDAIALADRLEAVVSGSAFPSHSVPADASAELARRHDPETYVRALRALLESSARRRPAASP